MVENHNSFKNYTALKHHLVRQGHNLLCDDRPDYGYPNRKNKKFGNGNMLAACTFDLASVNNIGNYIRSLKEYYSEDIIYIVGHDYLPFTTRGIGRDAEAKRVIVASPIEFQQPKKPVRSVAIGLHPGDIHVSNIYETLDTSSVSSLSSEDDTVIFHGEAKNKAMVKATDNHSINKSEPNDKGSSSANWRKQ